MLYRNLNISLNQRPVHHLHLPSRYTKSPPDRDKVSPLLYIPLALAAYGRSLY